MRVSFDLKNFEPFSFSVAGVTYTFSGVKCLAEKRNIEANIYESVVETPDGKKVWLTTVGETDQLSPTGIQRGWYVAQILSEENATFLVRALAEFTKLYQP